MGLSAVQHGPRGLTRAGDSHIVTKITCAPKLESNTVTWSSPTIPTDPQELIKALYAAIRAKDFAVARLYCHEDYVFTSNAHPERIGKNMHVVGPDKIAEHIAMVQRNWEILDKQPGRPKPPILEPGEPTDGSFV